MVLNQGPAGNPGPRARVLMVVRLFHPWVGGTERQAQKLARALLDAGAEVQVVTGRWFPRTPRHEIVDGVPVFRNHTLWEFFGIKGLRKLGGYLYILTLSWHLWRRRATYEVIHVHGLSYHTFAAAIMGRRLAKPVVVKLANSGPASDILRMREGQQLAGSRFMLPRALACDGFVALNAQVVSELAVAGVERSRIVEVPNGVATTVRGRTDHRLRDTPCILYVGRLHRQKGLDTLIRAFALLSARENPVDAVRLRLVGEGPARRELEELTETLGVGGKVHFAGSHEDVQPFLDDADVFVLPSSAEGLSNALLEAMACGLPVIVSEIPGNRDVVEDGLNGLLTPLGSASSLADTLSRILDDESLRARLGQAARSTILRYYDIERVTEEYLRLYQELRAGAVTDPARLGA